MVVSKRCKICTVIDAANIPISGEYFGKQLPKLIEKLCGIELDERKLNGVLICVHCALEVALTDVVIDKLRNSVLRLKKYVRESKTKTPLKEQNSIKKDLNGSDCKAGNDDSRFEKMVDDTLETITPKKVARRRKSEFPDNNISKTLEVDTETSILKNILNNKETPNDDKKRKPELFSDSVSPDFEDNDDFKPNKRTKTTSISVEDQCLNDLNVDEQDLDDKKYENSETLEVHTDELIFKKIPDKKDILKTDRKRKPKSFEDSVKKTDQSLMDSTPEQDLDSTGIKQKLNNCVICGKSFNKKSLLREHFDACHMGERLKECPHCSNEFRSQQKYDAHVFSEKCKNTLHPCQYPNCKKHFKTLHKMELHMQEKHVGET